MWIPKEGKERECLEIARRSSSTLGAVETSLKSVGRGDSECRHRGRGVAISTPASYQDLLSVLKLSMKTAICSLLISAYDRLF